MLSKMHSSMNMEELSRAPDMLYHVAVLLIRVGEKLNLKCKVFDELGRK